MPRPIAFLAAVTLSFACTVAYAQSSMKPSAPQKMMSPDEAERMHDCQKQAARNNIKMDERAKYVMDCMTAKAK
jgi:hypothetical protein